MQKLFRPFPACSLLPVTVLSVPLGPKASNFMTAAMAAPSSLTRSLPNSNPSFSLKPSSSRFSYNTACSVPRCFCRLTLTHNTGGRRRIRGSKTTPSWLLLNHTPNAAASLCSSASDAAFPVTEEGTEKRDDDCDTFPVTEEVTVKAGDDSAVESKEEEVEVEGEEKKPSSTSNSFRPNRRQKGSSSSSPIPPSNPDLLAIPGVGPRNLEKLVQKGIAGVAQLKQLYKDKFFGKSSEKMVEYLQSSVGIKHKNHAESITTFIKKSVEGDEEVEGNSSVPSQQKKRLTFCVEGNISVGKTTFLQSLANETIELRDLVEVVPEPIDKWQDIGPDHFNILEAFYSEPQRYAYTFQNYVFVTRVLQERESCAGVKPLRLMERSVFSDRMVFVRAVHEAKWMSEMEISIYESWFDPVVSTLPGLIPDAFIYLRASPDTCHKRMMLRKRSEEGSVSLDYLRGLHEKHESWLFPFESGNHGVLSVNKLPHHVDNSLHPDIRDRVFYLEGDHLHSSIQKVPALVLDCEPNIDFSKDVEAKREYARQVAEFFEFVKKNNEASSKVEGEKNRQAQSKVMLPHEGGLWLPGGKPFPQSSLKPLDFRRAMSVMSGSGS